MTASIEGTPIEILHLEDSLVDHELALYALRKAGLSYAAQRVQTLGGFQMAVLSRRFDLVLADYRLPGFTAVEAWNILEPLAHAPPFVILSGAIGEEAAVDAMRRGITDYLLKDNIGKLPHVVTRAIEVSRMRADKALADADLAASKQRLAEFAAHLQESIEQERASIAREIHDDIGGSLTAIRFDLSWIERHGSGTELLAHVASANQMLQHALGASQRIMMNLRPAVLDQGLMPALQWLLDGFSARTGVRAELTGGPVTEGIPRPLEIVAYRTAQEALTNVIKHAEATAVVVDVSAANDVLTVEVADNGRGIPGTVLQTTRGFGIKGLHERAKAVGGWLDVTNRNGPGTSIILTVPFSAEGKV